MREHREPWLKLPEKKPGGEDDGRLDRRFRTHVVMTRGAGAEPSRPPPEPSRSSTRLSPVSKLASSVLPFRPAGAAKQKPVGTAHAVEPVLKKPDPAPRPSPQHPPQPQLERNSGAAAPTASPRPAPPKRTGVRVPGAPPLGLNDLSPVSSADWASKVGEAAKMVDVIVVFYSAVYLDSEMFQVAFQTVVNEVLPQIGRPYTVYRFSLDAEPGFVAEMAESLGLPQDNPVTNAGFTWSGPGRRLFIIGDRALESRAAFSRFLRRSLMEQQQALPAAERGATHRCPESFQRGYPRERTMRSRAPLLGRRALAILAWCLFGTAALGAVVVGVAPQVANSILHPATVPAPGAALPEAQPALGTQANLNPPAANPDNSVGGTPGDEAQTPPPAKPVHTRARRKHTPSLLTLNPLYWGLPPEGRSR